MINKDEAINVVGICNCYWRDCQTPYVKRVCAKCLTPLLWYYGENECYLVHCPTGDTRTVVHATNPQMALDKVGVEE